MRLRRAGDLAAGDVVYLHGRRWDLLAVEATDDGIAVHARAAGRAVCHLHVRAGIDVLVYGGAQ